MPEPETKVLIRLLPRTSLAVACWSDPRRPPCRLLRGSEVMPESGVGDRTSTRVKLRVTRSTLLITVLNLNRIRA